MNTNEDSLLFLADVRIEELNAENAKLRELVDYMEPIAWYAASPNDRKRMRELGIEVDDA